MRRVAQRSGRWGLSGLFVTLCLGLALFASAAQALQAEDEEEIQAEETLPSDAGTHLADDHDPSQAAHPLHIVAYGLHPVGVALDWILVRPAVWVVRHEPFRTIFGYED